MLRKGFECDEESAEVKWPSESALTNHSPDERQSIVKTVLLQPVSSLISTSFTSHRPLWSRLNAVRLFVQHISLPCNDEDFNIAAYNFFNVSLFYLFQVW